MEKELDKIIKIGKDKYKINAFHAENATEASTATSSDVANEVKSPLIIKQTNSEGDEEFINFNGSESKEISIVSAENGGRFNKPISVPKVSENARDNISAEAVLNYDDIKEVVLTSMINNSASFDWDNSKSSYKLTPKVENGTIKGISIVTGSEDDLGDFITYNNNNKKLPVYLYISTKDNTQGFIPGYIYYGEYGKNEMLRISANNADYLRAFEEDKSDNRPGLDKYSAANIYDAFSNIDNMLANIKDGTIPVGKLSTDDGPVTGQDLKKYISDLQNSIENFTTGDSTVRSASYATNAEYASKDPEGTEIRSNYYRYASGSRNNDETGRRITISTEIPNDRYGAEGDIWIVYKKSKITDNLS